MTLAQAILVPEFWYGLTAIVAVAGLALAVVLTIVSIVKGA